MTGFAIASIGSSRSISVGASIGLPNSLMSAPAMKVRPAQIITIALIAASADAASSPSAMPSRRTCESALTGGLSRVSSPISPSFVSVAASLMRVMLKVPSVRLVSCGAAFRRRSGSGNSPRRWR